MWAGYQQKTFEMLCNFSSVQTYVIVLKGGVAVLGGVSPSEVIWRGQTCVSDPAGWVAFIKAGVVLQLTHRSGLAVSHNRR